MVSEPYICLVVESGDFPCLGHPADVLSCKFHAPDVQPGAWGGLLEVQHWLEIW
jgi:hypothetical protein